MPFFHFSQNNSGGSFDYSEQQAPFLEKQDVL